MLNIRKNSFIVIICFLTVLLFSHYLEAEEELKNTLSVQQKGESEQEHSPSLTIKGAKIEIVPGRKASEQKKIESKKEQAIKEGQPQISFEYNNYDVGEVWEGEEIVHAFIIKNTGTAQLNIKDVSPG